MRVLVKNLLTATVAVKSVHGVLAQGKDQCRRDGAAG
jgi:hypothetical protein